MIFPLENVPLALEDGAVKVTEAPLIGVPFWVTTADSSVGKVVPTNTLCNDPFVAFTANTLRDEEDDDELELAQAERTTKAATQVVRAKTRKALPRNDTFRPGLLGIVETTAGFRSKPRSLMSRSLLGQILVLTSKLELGGDGLRRKNLSSILAS